MILHHLHRIAFALLVCLCMTACESNRLPVYWYCQGESTQTVRDLKTMAVLEEYGGFDRALFVMFNGHFYQENATALFGAYVICEDNGILIEFMSNCSTKVINNDGVYRRGILSRANGSLVFNERRVVGGQEIKGEANYQCEYLGRSFTVDRVR